jgi:hypothetical protein
MLDTLRVYEDLAQDLEPTAARKIAALVGKVYDDLSQAVTKADLHEVREVLAELAQAEQRTEARLEQLAQAQQRTEVEIRALARGLKETRQMVAGLSDAVGYGLEDRAIERLPALLLSEHGIRVERRLVRRFVEYPDGRTDEVNLFGRGRRNGTELTVVGEAKARPGKADVDRFLKLVGRLEQHGFIEGRPFLVLVGYSIHPGVERYARSRDLAVVPSYLLGSS